MRRRFIHCFFPVSESLSRLLWQPGEVGLVPLLWLCVFPLKSPHLPVKRRSSLFYRYIFSSLPRNPIFGSIHLRQSFGATTEISDPHDVDLSGYRLFHLRV